MTFTHKGKTYTASRICPAGENMYWKITTQFMRKTKVSELGCMTESENEVAKSLKNPNPKKYNIAMVNTKLTELLTEESFPLEIL